MKNQWYRITMLLCGLRLREHGLTIEPMINNCQEIDTDMETGWAHRPLTVAFLVSHEHQFVIKDGPVILTSQVKKELSKRLRKEEWS